MKKIPDYKKIAADRQEKIQILEYKIDYLLQAIDSAPAGSAFLYTENLRLKSILKAAIQRKCQVSIKNCKRKLKALNSIKM